MKIMKFILQLKFMILIEDTLTIIRESNEEVLFIASYYDKNLGNNYIVSGNNGYIKSYDYKLNNLYHKYKDSENNEGHKNIIIHDKESLPIYNWLKEIDLLCYLPLFIKNTSKENII